MLGRTATLDGVAHEIVGVVTSAPAFENTDVYRPLAKAGPATSRRNHAYQSVARLAPSASIESATRELDTIFGRLEAAYPDTNRGWRMRLTPLRSTLTEDLTATVLLLGAVVTTLLLIGCANIASLLVSRARDRRREFGVRTALGASRRRLVRQVVTECVVLCLCGALAGITLAWWGARAIVGLVSDEITLWNTPSVDWRVIGFAIGLSVTTGVLFGWLPAMTSSRWRPQDAMRGGAGSVTRSGRRTRAALTFVQIALALVLLVCASLLISSLTRVLHVDPGFPRAGRHHVPRHAVTRDLCGCAGVVAYYESLLERLRTLPGLAGHRRGFGPAAGRQLDRPRRHPARRSRFPSRTNSGWRSTRSRRRVISAAIGMNLLRGRDFTDADSATSPPVAIINESMAQTLWGTAESSAGKS